MYAKKKSIKIDWIGVVVDNLTFERTLVYLNVPTRQRLNFINLQLYLTTH